MLYYSHVNEDNRIEKDLLTASGCVATVAVAGSGERVIALLNAKQCKDFHVVDINEEALYLLQLKLEALMSLDLEEYYQFTGLYHAGKEERLNWFRGFRTKLNVACRMYWEKNISFIETGIINAGHFEKFLSRVRPSVNLFLGKKFQNILTGMPVQSSQFPAKRWKLLKKIYSFRWVYSLWGNRDIAFISKDAITHHIPDALDEVIYKNESASCFMMHLIFKGHLRNMKENELPPSIQKELLQSVRQRLINGSANIHYHHTDLLSFMKERKTIVRHPVFYSASDVLSFESYEYLQDLLDNSAGDGSIIVWRAFLRNRNSYIEQIINRRSFRDSTEKESTRMYQVFSVAY